MAMVYALQEKGQEGTAQMLKVVKENSVVRSLEYWPRVTMGTPIEWLVEDMEGNARAALEGLMDLWPRVTMGTVNANQSEEPVSASVDESWPVYTWGTAYPLAESESMGAKEHRAKLLADLLDVWPRITLANPVID